MAPVPSLSVAVPVNSSDGHSKALWAFGSPPEHRAHFQCFVCRSVNAVLITYSHICVHFYKDHVHMDEHPQRSQGEAGSWELGGTPRVESNADSLPLQLTHSFKRTYGLVLSWPPKHGNASRHSSGACPRRVRAH